MPRIQIQMLKGRTAEQKRRLAKGDRKSVV